MKKVQLKIVILMMVLALVMTGPASAFASGNENGSGPITSDAAIKIEGNGSAPNYVPSAIELQQRAAKEALAANRVAIAAAGDYDRTLSVGVWKQPEDAKYINHCGPASTQVALDVRLDASKVPSLDTLAKEEKTNDGKTGTYMQDIKPVLNKRLSTSWYVIGNAKDQARLGTWIRADMDFNYAMVTGAKTGRMPGWGGRNVNHIVAVYGFRQPVSGSATVRYTDTASKKAGFTGNYWNSASLSDFWSYVKDNNIQAW
jgi:hypothetical protein